MMHAQSEHTHYIANAPYHLFFSSSQLVLCVRLLGFSFIRFGCSPNPKIDRPTSGNQPLQFIKLFEASRGAWACVLVRVSVWILVDILGMRAVHTARSTYWHRRETNLQTDTCTHRHASSVPRRIIRNFYWKLKYGQKHKSVWFLCIKYIFQMH